VGQFWAIANKVDQVGWWRGVYEKARFLQLLMCFWLCKNHTFQKIVSQADQTTKPTKLTK
jgi:hypothetical protein